MPTLLPRRQEFTIFHYFAKYTQLFLRFQKFDKKTDTFSCRFPKNLVPIIHEKWKIVREYEDENILFFSEIAAEGHHEPFTFNKTSYQIFYQKEHLSNDK